MQQEQQKPIVKKHHVVNIDGRNKGSVTGVLEVVSYAETQLYLKSSEGDLTITGRGLKIVKYGAEDGMLAFTGEVDAMKYVGQKVPLRARLFK